MNINSINVNKYPISQMFDPDSRTVFEIPKYQREYVWGTREWAALYDDLFENGEGYFLGSIICINSTTNTLSPKFEVVDGQQRLTTTSLFLAALYDILNAHSGKYIGYRNGLNLNADVADKTAWTVDAIKARTDSMVEKILAMFQL